MRTRKIIVGFLTCSTLQLAAQGIPSEGRDFYLGYIHPSYNDVVPDNTAGYFRTFALVSSYEDNVVSVSYFDPVTKKEESPSNFAVKARRAVQIPLDRVRMQMTGYGETGAEFKSCHLTAKKPIHVQYFSSGANSGGSYLALPVVAWAKEYVVASYPDNGTGKGARGAALTLDKAAGIFMLVAAYDTTQVTITPMAHTAGGHVGQLQGQGAIGIPRPYTITLYRGQCWLVKSSSAQIGGEDDISGSTLTSTKPVAVISGHEDAMTGNGTTGTYAMEGRDYMLEQMIPVASWDTTGYITVPMATGDGLGEDVRAYVFPQNVSGQITAAHAAYTENMVLGNPHTEIAELNNVREVTHYSASHKFMLMQYDLRSHGLSGPHPTPSMMSIVPRSRWRRDYLLYVPSSFNNAEKQQFYSATIIAPKNGVPQYYPPKDYVLIRNWFDSIRLSVNGSNSYTSIYGLGTSLRTWEEIPGHADLQAITFELSPGKSLHLKSPVPFMVYYAGYRGLSYDGYLGTTPNDYYLSFATPAGMMLGRSGPARLRALVDTLCGKWRVCVSDSNIGDGIRSVTLLNDPQGGVLGKSYVYKNVSFATTNDPTNPETLVFPEGRQNVCFEVVVDRPEENAHAPVYIVDVNGNGTLVLLQAPKADVDYAPSLSDGLVLQPLDSAGQNYSRSLIQEKICKEYRLINIRSSARSYSLQAVRTGSFFTITHVTPSVGTLLKPGDTLTIGVCFTGTDIEPHNDSIVVETDCYTFRLPIFGQAGSGMIFADDMNFGSVLVGKSSCRAVAVTNVGTKPMTLDTNWYLSNSSENEFALDSTFSENRLPRTLLPGRSHTFTLCYAPVDHGPDNGWMLWSSDIVDAVKGLGKPFSDFSGSGIDPGLRWDRSSVTLIAGDNLDTLYRVYLRNSGHREVELSGIWIDGPDANEFRIKATEFNTNPPTWKGTVLPYKDTLWVDVEFKADTTTFQPYRTRLAQLRTSSSTYTTAFSTLDLRGELVSANVNRDDEKHVIALRPNPARGEVTLELALKNTGEVQVQIFDMLGREVVQSIRAHCTAGVNSLTFRLPSIASGMYFVRVTADGKVQTLPLEIRR